MRRSLSFFWFTKVGGENRFGVKGASGPARLKRQHRFQRRASSGNGAIASGAADVNGCWQPPKQGM
ncbi:MAG: hypothetical protein IKE23_08240 [Exiguobacterium sp.]|nr:hypothetical protein [Exiguobacterium sp.]